MGALSMCVKINLSVKTCVWYIYISSTHSSSHTNRIHLVFFFQVVNYILLQLWLLMNEWMTGCVRAGAQFGCWDFCIKESGDTGYCIKSKCYWSYVVGGSEIDLTNFSSVKTGCRPLTQGWQVYSLVAQNSFFTLLGFLSSFLTIIMEHTYCRSFKS